METRKPVVAGQFYPFQCDDCIAELTEYLEQTDLPDSLPDTIDAGIVPHAGWIFSGQLAASVFAAIKQRHENVHTFVIFGAAHSYWDPQPAIYDKGFWKTPLGEIAIDEELAEEILKTEKAVSNPKTHKNEHSIEVQVPLIQHMFPGAKILPIITPPAEESISLGQAVGEIIKIKKDKKIICLGSTDLTHYGPRYGFEPMGSDAQALQWAFDVNDKEFIELALKLNSDEILKHASSYSSACGPGAAAAAVEAAKTLGKTQGQLLAHTNSNEIMIKKMGTSGDDSVGYAAIVF